jgi:hypothetical protein
MMGKVWTGFNWLWTSRSDNHENGWPTSGTEFEPRALSLEQTARTRNRAVRM